MLAVFTNYEPLRRDPDRENPFLERLLLVVFASHALQRRDPAHANPFPPERVLSANVTSLNFVDT